MRTLEQLHSPGNFSSWAEIPEPIRARLGHEGLDSPAAWRDAGKRRAQIFGVTRRVAEQLDQLARGAP